jgi:hypothetical protein
MELAVWLRNYGVSTLPRLRVVTNRFREADGKEKAALNVVDEVLSFVDGMGDKKRKRKRKTKKFELTIPILVFCGPKSLDAARRDLKEAATYPFVLVSSDTKDLNEHCRPILQVQSEGTTAAVHASNKLPTDGPQECNSCNSPLSVDVVPVQPSAGEQLAAPSPSPDSLNDRSGYASPNALPGEPEQLAAPSLSPCPLNARAGYTSPSAPHEEPKARGDPGLLATSEQGDADASPV